MLQQSQFQHTGLSDVYFTGQSQVIPPTQWGRCNRLLGTLASAVSATSPNLPGSGFNMQGNVYSLNVSGKNKITYKWRAGAPADINYV
jgi:hypothetical protein